MNVRALPLARSERRGRRIGPVPRLAIVMNAQKYKRATKEHSPRAFDDPVLAQNLKSLRPLAPNARSSIVRFCRTAEMLYLFVLPHLLSSK
jgi:hypothetical protein